MTHMRTDTRGSSDGFTADIGLCFVWGGTARVLWGRARSHARSKQQSSAGMDQVQAQQHIQHHWCLTCRSSSVRTYRAERAALSAGVAPRPHTTGLLSRDSTIVVSTSNLPVGRGQCMVVRRVRHNLPPYMAYPQESHMNAGIRPIMSWTAEPRNNDTRRIRRICCRLSRCW